jgi:hypothetical protein
MNTGTEEKYETSGNQIIYEVEDLTTYNVTVTTVDKAGHESVPSEILEIKTSFTGIVDLPKTCFKIYPNPANDILYIEAEITEPANVEIFNISGSKISMYVMMDNNYSINVSTLTLGIYFVKVGNSVQKLVKF